MALICKMPLSENLWGPYISTDKGFAKCITFINCTKLGVAVLDC